MSSMDCSSFAVGNVPLGGDAGESRLEMESLNCWRVSIGDRNRAAIDPAECGVFIAKDLRIKLKKMKRHKKKISGCSTHYENGNENVNEK